MTMTAQERNQLTELVANQAATMKEMEHMKDSMTRIHSRLDEMHDYLKGITSNVCEINKQNAMHEERLSALQETTASLGETVLQLDKSCKRLKHVSFAFLGLVIAMTVLVGLLGEEVLPKAVRWLWALVGL